VGTVLPAFQKRLLHLKPIWISKPGRLPPCWFSKAVGATLRNLCSNRSKGFDLACFEKLQEIQKAFGVEQLRTY
jgi:hypothetical protein